MNSIQKININDEHAKCNSCGHALINLSDFLYDGFRESTATYREERCRCKHCGHPFILHYDIFDEDGHVYPQIFTGDINDPNYTWQSILTDDQKNAISEHLETCSECQDRLSEEILTDAIFASMIQELRSKRKK